MKVEEGRSDLRSDERGGRRIDSQVGDVSFVFSSDVLVSIREEVGGIEVSHELGGRNVKVQCVFANRELLALFDEGEERSDLDSSSLPSPPSHPTRLSPRIGAQGLLAY